MAAAHRARCRVSALEALALAVLLVACLALGAHAACIPSTGTSSTSCPYPQCENGGPSRIGWEEAVSGVMLFDPPAQSPQPGDLRNLDYIARLPIVPREGVFPTEFRLTWNFNFGTDTASLDVYFIDDPSLLVKDGEAFRLTDEAQNSGSNQIITLRDRMFCSYVTGPTSSSTSFELPMSAFDNSDYPTMQRPPWYMFARLNGGTRSVSGVAKARVLEAWFPKLTSIYAAPMVPAAPGSRVYIGAVCGPAEKWGDAGSKPERCVMAWAAAAGAELVGANLTLAVYADAFVDAAARALRPGVSNPTPERTLSLALPLAGQDPAVFPASFPRPAEEAQASRWLSLSAPQARGPFHVFAQWGPGAAPARAASATPHVYVRTLSKFPKPTAAIPPPPPPPPAPSSAPAPATQTHLQSQTQPQTSPSGTDSGSSEAATSASKREAVIESAPAASSSGGGGGGGPSTGMIVGIVVGVIVVGAVLGVSGVVCFRRHVLQRRDALGGFVGPSGFSASARGQSQLAL
eukprot:tig00021168_g19091.t1